MSDKGSSAKGAKDLPFIYKRKPIPHFPTVWSWLSHTIRYLIYVAFHYIYSFLQYHVVWRLNGTLKQLHDSYLPENYERSAQVLKVVFTFRYDVVLQPVGMVDFVLVHEKFTHPEYVLKDNIDVYYVDENKAIFTEAEEGVQQWRSDYHAFFRIAQQQQAIRVVLLPMHAASRLTDKIGDPKAKLIILSITARCGSTLLSQVYERTGKCVVFAEPGGLQNLSMYEQQKMSPAKVDKITRVVFRLFCKPVKSPEEVVAYVFKPIAGTLDLVSAIQRVYPNAKHLFNYRDIKTMANSIQKLRYPCPLVQLMWWGGSRSNLFLTEALKISGLSTDLTTRFIHPTDLGYVMWGASVRRYLNMRQQGVDIVGFFYEDLVKNKKYAVQKAFEHTGMPTDLVDLGVKALDKDSQGESGLGRQDFLNYVDYKIAADPYLISLGNRVTKIFGLPNIDGDVHVEGTISTEK